MPFDQASWRDGVVRRHDQHDRPLYEAALRGDDAALAELDPSIPPCRVAAMIATAQGFALIQSGWVEDAFVTVVFDRRFGLWRPQAMFRGKDCRAVCVVCGRAAIYQVRGAGYCRAHGPADRGFPLPSPDFASLGG